MDLNTYQRESRKIYVHPKDHEEPALEFLTIGMMEELGEFFEAETTEELIKECGDWMFYVSQIFYELGFPLEKIEYEDPLTRNLWLQTWQYGSRVCGVVKKIERDKTHLELRSEIIINYLSSMYDAILSILFNHGVNITVVLQTNIDKLYERIERNVLAGEGDDR